MGKNSEQFIEIRGGQAINERSNQEQERINRLQYMELDGKPKPAIQMLPAEHYLSVNNQLS